MMLRPTTSEVDVAIPWGSAVTGHWMTWRSSSASVVPSGMSRAATTTGRVWGASLAIRGVGRSWRYRTAE